MNRYSYNIFKHKKITLDINRTELSCWMIIENSLKYKEKNTLRIYTVHTFYILFNKQGDNRNWNFCHNKGYEALDPCTYKQFEKLLKSYLKAVNVLGRTYVQKYDVMHVFIYFIEYHIIYVLCFKRLFFYLIVPV